MKFELTSTYKPTGDQPQAIEKLTQGLKRGNKHQTLLGVTGSGKTFTIANVINQIQKPTLVISHNKTLAAQLYQEFREFFPKNAVSYFVSYYDYYQPEAYLPATDTYIEKETEINEEIDKLRLATTTALATRHDVIIVASVSAIYNLGSPSEYQEARLSLEVSQKWQRRDLLVAFAKLQYERNDTDFERGTYRVRGESIEILPAYENNGLRLTFAQDFLRKIEVIHPISGQIVEQLDQTEIYPVKHYIASEKTTKIAIESIKKELEERLKFFQKANKQLETHRLKARTNYDIEMIQTIGMYNGDRARKEMLVDFGFRLPSAFDNRPLKFEEFSRKVNLVIYTSATPTQYELSISQQVVEQLIRPTGLTDPEIIIRKSEGQIEDLICEIQKTVKLKERVLITTLTKRMAEELANYLQEKGLKVQYLHSEVQTLDRSDILDDLRLGNYDVLVGINLLREGLDLPEVSLVAILDADKEGFLRSETSLIQTMGRAARHVAGRVILYADRITGSMQRAIEEIEHRRKVQIEYNHRHYITPKSITKPIREKLVEREKIYEEKTRIFRDEVIESAIKRVKEGSLLAEDRQKYIKVLTREMKDAARILDFERAAVLRDQIYSLKNPPPISNL